MRLIVKLSGLVSDEEKRKLEEEMKAKLGIEHVVVVDGKVTEVVVLGEDTPLVYGE